MTHAREYSTATTNKLTGRRSTNSTRSSTWSMLHYSSAPRSACSSLPPWALEHAAWAASARRLSLRSSWRELDDSTPMATNAHWMIPLTTLMRMEMIGLSLVTLIWSRNFSLCSASWLSLLLAAWLVALWVLSLAQPWTKIASWTRADESHNS